MGIISSTQNKRIRYVKSLQTKGRLRRSERKLILEGDRLIADALRRGGKPAQAFYAPTQANYELIAQLQARNCPLQAVSEAVLRYASDTQQAPGLLAIFDLPRPRLPQLVARALILDGISEPGNLGTILRAAAAADAQLAILAPGCVDPYNPKALRAGMGAHFSLPVVEASWKEISAFCQDLPIYAASAAATKPYTQVDWRGSWALLLGNEAHGLSQPARKLARESVSIPLAAESESLNVASAAAVILFEARRQALLADPD